MITRNDLLRLAGAASGSLLLTRCGGGGANSAVPATASASAAATATASSTAAAAAAAAGTCTVTPEGEIGPFFSDDSASGFDRSNILSSIDGTGTQSGIPFTLNVFVYDTEKSCAPYAGAQVDIWHCNAPGIYSDQSSENTTTVTWLRGYQIASASGLVTFQTIVPGWYAGRTTHIHLRVRSSYSEASSTSDGTNTTQVFFPQATLDYISTKIAPYSSAGINPTTNATDRVYSQQTQGKNLMTLGGDYTGFTATVSIGLPITTI